MGIDGLIYLMVVKDDHPDVGASLTRANLTGDAPGSPGWLIYEEPDCIEIWTGDRYYGDGYYMGQWPQIRETITWLQATYPGIEIRYGDDGGYADVATAPSVTPEWLAERDAIWEGNARG